MQRESNRTESSTNEEPFSTFEEEVDLSDARQRETWIRGPAKLNREQALALMKAHLAAADALRKGADA